jgi:glutathionyl-hydroquinone reductase
MASILARRINVFANMSKGENKQILNWVKPGDTSGEFKRQVSSFRYWIEDKPDAQFPPEKGRYHLYISYACPWAHRTLIYRQLKGLEDIVSYSSVHWHLAEGGKSPRVSHQIFDS